MKEHLLKTVKQFRFKSIFTMILVSMIALCIVLCSILSIFFTNTISDTSTENLKQTNQIHLNAIVENLDYLVKNNLHQSIVQLSYSHSILSLAFSNKQGNFNVNIAAGDIAFAVKYNRLIESSILYYPKHDSIITSSYQKYTRDAYPNDKMITTYESTTNVPINIEDNGKISSLFSYDGNYVLAFDFPLYGSRRLATLYYVVNMHELYQYVISNVKDDQDIWVFDSSNVPVFSSETKYPAYITAETISELEASGGKSMDYGQYTIFISTSDITGWKYLYIADNSILSLTTGDIVLALLPSMLVILVFALIASWFITLFLYRPFQRLLSAVDSKNFAPEVLRASKSEVDYLNYAFSDMKERNQGLQTMMQIVSKDVMSRLFSDLISGVHVDYVNIKEILASVQSPFRVNAAYIACVVHCMSDLNSVAGQRMALLDILNDLMSFFNKKNKTLSHVINIDSQTFAVILSFDVNASILTMKKDISDLKISIIDRMKRANITTIFSAGNIYHSILDIGFSYTEAYSALTYDTDIQSNLPERGDKVNWIDTVRVVENDFDTRIQKLLSIIQNNSINVAQQFLECILEDGYASCQDIEVMIQFHKTFIVALLDEIVKIESINLCSFPDNIPAFDEQQLSMMDAFSLQAETRNICANILTEISKIFKKKQNHFFIAAKEYIAQYYSDSNLSLNTVAEAIDANPSYISRLFREVLDISFTKYITICRLEASAKLLQDKNLAIKDVATQSGFNTVQNYMRLFKKFYGKTPGQYREDL